MSGSKVFASLIVTIITVALVFLFMPILQAQTENMATRTTISRLSQLGYWVIPATAAGAGNLVTNNIVPFSDSTYDIGASGNEYRTAYFDDMLVGGENVTRSATFTVASSASSQQADYTCSGTDDQIQIQAAIDALPTTGGKVVLSDGTFNLTNSIDVSNVAGYSYVTLEGQGQSTCLATPGMAHHFITTSIITNRNMYITLRDFRIDGRNHTGGKHGIYLWAAAYFRAENLNIVSCNGTGIYLDTDVTWYANNAWISNTRINKCGGDGILISQYHNDYWIWANEIWDNTGYGVYASGGAAQIWDNEISSNGEYGIRCGGYWQQVNNNHLSGNNHGIVCSGGGDYAVLTGNIIKDNVVNGVWLSAGANNTQVKDNYFNGNGTDVLDSGTDSNIKDNLGYVTENSAVSLGTGAQQTIAHGLSFTPVWQDIGVFSDNATGTAFQTAAPDANNIYVTATADSRWHWGTIGK